MFWNHQVETLSRSDMFIWQNHKLNKVIERVYEKSLLYRKHMLKCGLEPEHIKTVDDLVKLPFTTRQDLVENYPYGLLTMPVSGVSYIHQSKDRENKLAAMSYTSHDIGMWTELMSRILVAGGVNVTTVFQIAVSGQQYQECLGVSYGARQVGAALVPGNGENVTGQFDLMQNFGVNGIYSTPEYLLSLAQEVRIAGSKPEELPLQTIFCSLHSLSDELSERIKKEYGIKLIEIYGLDDVFGMGIGGECQCRDGLHLQEDCFFPEIINPVSGEVVVLGDAGELVLTSLSLEAMPMIRYRTGLHGYLDDSQCACGRTLIRFKKNS